MVFVQFAGFAHTRTYSSATQPDWPPGEVRSVPDDEAARLLKDFPGAFVRPGLPEPTKAVVEAPKPALVSEPADLSELLATNANTLAAEVKAGKHDTLLDGLAAVSTSTRVKSAIEARKGALAGG